MDAGYFLTSFFLVSGIALALVLYRADIIESGAMIQSVGGGILVYGTIIAYQYFFGPEEEF